jgi:hypothetical protein
MGKRLKESPDLVANRKSLGGVPPSAFVDFCVIGGQSLSLHLVETFKVEEGQGSNTLKSFVISRMLESPQYSELIVVGSAQGAVIPYTHACTFVAINQGDKPHLAYCDCQGKDVEWYPAVPPTQTGTLLNFNDEFDNFWVLQVFCIERADVTKEDASKINNDMTYVMTGTYPDNKAMKVAVAK